MTQAFDKPCFVTLPQRGVIRVGGAEARKFLQNLVTNDLAKLDKAPALYACLLTAQGKFLHDFFVTVEEDDILLECEGGARTHDLLKRLTLYKLRSPVTLSAESTIAVYAVFGTDDGYQDPRSPALGRRSFIKPDLPEAEFSRWDEARITLGLPDGSRDADLQVSTLEELNLAHLAVSFDKGCYVGQELTARMEHRGLGKKHLTALSFKEAPPPAGTDLMAEGRLIGTMRSSCGRTGLALVRDDMIDTIRNMNGSGPYDLLGQ